MIKYFVEKNSMKRLTKRGDFLFIALMVDSNNQKEVRK